MKHTSAYRLFLCLALLLVGSLMGHAQQLSKEAARYEIDAKRMGVDYFSKDALPRSREFKRLDSTYYIGWMLEGTYTYDRAADYQGFSNAVAPLKKAVQLMEKDFAKQLGTRSADVMGYLPTLRYQQDYNFMVYCLYNCYSNLEEADSAYTLIRRYSRFNIQKEFFVETYNALAWLYHRNRFYTSDKFSFLKNNIEENEKMVKLMLDSGMIKVATDNKLNNTIFQPQVNIQDYDKVYHYYSLYFAYNFKVDSALKYYNKMRSGPYFPYNNYANFMGVLGNFDEAYEYYNNAAMQDAGDKRLQEWSYYTSILDVYTGRLKTGINRMTDFIQAVGSTPGYGWYNIGLARMYAYDGQLDKSEVAVTKAKGFKELHIGTTLGQNHYDFSASLVDLNLMEKRYAALKFEHKNWWYNPIVLGQMATLKGKLWFQRFMLVNQFAGNPERDRVVYRLFSTESTVSWDEIWLLIKNFSTRYFTDTYRKYLGTDERPAIKKYYRYSLAKLYMKQGKTDEAGKLFQEIMQDSTYKRDKLLQARVTEALAQMADDRGDDRNRDELLYRMYLIYPQLIPFGELKMNFRLNAATADGDKDFERIVRKMKKFRVNWTNDYDSPAPEAYLRFDHEGKAIKVKYYVVDRTGNIVVPMQVISIKDEDKDVPELVYRLFNCGNENYYRLPEEEAAAPAEAIGQ